VGTWQHIGSTTSPTSSSESMAPVTDPVPRQHSVHFALPKLADPFTVPTSGGHLPTDSSRRNSVPTYRPGKAMLSEAIEHERSRGLSKKKSSKRDILAPKHAGISKKGNRSPLGRRDSNMKMNVRRSGSVKKKTAATRRRRMVKLQPHHPLLRVYEGKLNSPS
jgi:hypothetical protein